MVRGCEKLSGKIFSFAGIWSAGNGILADHAVFPSKLAVVRGYLSDSETVTVVDVKIMKTLQIR